MWQGEYERYINLSESCEGDLLKIEGRPEFFTSKAYRHRTCNVNYYDYTMQRGGYPEVLGTRGELFFTAGEERQLAKEAWVRSGNFNIVWALNGSSHHKVYPLMEPMLAKWLPEHPKARVITVGDYTAKLLEFDHPQLVHRCAEWSIRQSMLATKYAQLVIGPETAITNASGCFDTPKIVLLSHSTKENLTKYFLNDHSLEPSVDVAPCWPCHQLHYTAESCPVGAMTDNLTGEALGTAPICTFGVEPERLMAEMSSVYTAWEAKCS